MTKAAVAKVWKLPVVAGRRYSDPNRNPPVFFSTQFLNTENPLSLGGIVRLGGTDGLLWQNPQSIAGTPGICCATGSSPTDDTDNIFVIANRFSTRKFYTQFVVNRDPAYTAPITNSYSHEVELFVGNINANSINGYEVTCPIGGQLDLVRWNGPLNNFTEIGTGNWTDTLIGSGVPGGVSDGDVMMLLFDSLTLGHPVLTVYHNGSQVYQVADTSASANNSCSPGGGFFARPGTGLDLTKYCMRGTYQADNA